MTKIWRKKEWEGAKIVQRDPVTRVNQELIQRLNEEAKEQRKENHDKLIRKNKDIKKKN